MQRLEGLTRPFTANEVTLVRGDGGSLLTLTGQSFIAAPLQAPQAAKTGEQPEKATEEKGEAPATPAPASGGPSATPSATAPAEQPAAPATPAVAPSEQT
jgi:hypothetical protein